MEPGFRGYSGDPRWRCKPCGAVVSGPFTTCLGRFVVFLRVWHKRMLARNAAQIGAGVDQFDGHLIMRPAPLVGHGIGVSGHGGRSQ